MSKFPRADLLGIRARHFCIIAYYLRPELCLSLNLDVLYKILPGKLTPAYVLSIHWEDRDRRIAVSLRQT